MPFKKNKGIAHIALILFAAVGLLFFLFISSSASFKNSLFSSLFPKTPSKAAGADVTTQLENLGTITARYPFAKNIWDMQSFNNRVYIGYGDSVNNAGPIDLTYFDIASSSIKKDSSSGTLCGITCVDEEVVNNLKVIDNTLYIPGRDPRDDFSFGNFYRIENGVWKKYRNIPNRNHDYDIYKYNNKLFDGGELGVSIRISSDNGLSWQNATATGSGSINPWTGQPLSVTTVPVRKFFELNGNFYAITFYNVKVVLARYDSGLNFINIDDATAQKFFPSGPNASKLIEKMVNFNNQLVYIGSALDTVTNLTDPFGLFAATDITTARAITLPNSAKPRDLLVNGTTAYVLASTGSGSSYINYVYSSADLTNWTEVFRFSSNTFARSFEVLNGDFYFGMGTDSTTLPSPSTGNILRVKQAVYQPTPSPTAISNPVTPSPGTKQGDINGDNSVNIIDLSILLSKWNSSDASSDLNKDGKVSIIDLSILLSNWGK